MKHILKVMALALTVSAFSLQAARITRINSFTQLQSILASTQTVVIKFFAEWCGPCKRYKKNYEHVSSQIGGATFVEVDSDACSDIASAYGVRSLPTTIIVKNGQPVAKVTGVQGESELKDLVKQNL